MQLFWIILCSLCGPMLLWLLMLYTRRQKPEFHGLASYAYAHRGLHDSQQQIPENSMLAFRLARENGYGAELDVRITKDGELVIMHDESLLRTAGVNREVHACTLAELRDCRLEGTQERIPLLREVLELFAGQAPLVIEAKTYKSNYSELMPALCALLDAYPALQFCIESFDPRVIFWLRRHRPEIIRGQLSLNFFRERNGQNPLVVFIMSNLLLNFICLPHFIAFKVQHRRAPALRLCRRIWGVQEFVWTVKTEAQFREVTADHCLVIFEHCHPALQNIKKVAENRGRL